MIPKQLRRKKNNKIIGGVAAGLADYFKIDVVLVRLFFAIACIAGLSGALIYIICWIFIPEENDNTSAQYTTYEDIKQEDTSRQNSEAKQEKKENKITSKNTYWRIFPAIGFIFMGIYFLLITNNFIGFSFYKLFKAWPIIFIFIGLGFLNINKWIKYSLSLTVLIIVLFIASKSPRQSSISNFRSYKNITSIPNSHWEKDSLLNLKLNYVATNTCLNFSNYKLSSLDLELTASNITCKLGYPEQIVPIKIETSVSNLTLRIPDDVNCKFDCESSLSSVDFNDFKHSNTNFDASKPYFNFKIEANLSKVRIEKYR